MKRGAVLLIAMLAAGSVSCNGSKDAEIARLKSELEAAKKTVPAKPTEDGPKPWPDQNDDVRPLPEVARLLAENGGKRGWISEDFPFTHEFKELKGKKAKRKLYIRFFPEKDKTSGKATIGYEETPAEEKPPGISDGVTNVSSDVYTFELVEISGKRILVVRGSAATVDGKPVEVDPRYLHYTLQGDTLTIREFHRSAWYTESKMLEERRFKPDK
jgi:hypothetical protein